MGIPRKQVEHLIGRNITEPAKKTNKYRVAAKEDRTWCGHIFASKKEMNRYLQLMADGRSGLLKFLCYQPVFLLPGGIKYRADFLYVTDEGYLKIEDVKGFKTPEYKLKKKLMLAIYGVEIKEI